MVADWCHRLKPGSDYVQSNNLQEVHCHKPWPTATVAKSYQRLYHIQQVLQLQTPIKDWIWFEKCYCHRDLPETRSDPGSASVDWIWSRKCYCYNSYQRLNLIQEVQLLQIPINTVTNPYQRLYLTQEVLLSKNSYKRFDLIQDVILSQTPTTDWIWSRMCYYHKPLPETEYDPGSSTVIKPLPETGSDQGSATVTNPY